VTLEQESRAANLIVTGPTPAKASSMVLLPASLLAMYSQMLSGGRVYQDSSSIFIPSSNLSKKR